MTYHLYIKEKEESYKPLNISQVDKFKRTSALKGDSYSLKDIDCFTAQYKSEASLKLALYNFNIININDIDKEISIRRDKDNKKVMYDLVYENRKKYLNLKFLEECILKNSKNEDFLKELICKYKGSKICGDIVRKIVENIESKDQNRLELYLRNFVFSETYDAKYKRMRYDSLHNLAMFVCNYNEKEQLLKKGTDKKKQAKIIKEDLKEMQEDIRGPIRQEKENYLYDELGYIIKEDEINWGIPDEPIYDYQKPENNKRKGR